MNQQTVLGGLGGAAIGGVLGWIVGKALTQRAKGGPGEAPELGAILGAIGVGVIGAAVATPSAPPTATVASNTTVIPPPGVVADATNGGTTLPPPGA